MTLRIFHGYLLTPAPWLRARAAAASQRVGPLLSASSSEPLRAEVIQPRAQLPAAPELRALPPPASLGAPAQAARAAHAYAAARESLRAWAVGCQLRVEA